MLILFSNPTRTHSRSHTHTQPQSHNRLGGAHDLWLSSIIVWKENKKKKKRRKRKEGGEKVKKKKNQTMPSTWNMTISNISIEHSFYLIATLRLYNWLAINGSTRAANVTNFASFSEMLNSKLRCYSKNSRFTDGSVRGADNSLLFKSIYCLSNSNLPAVTVESRLKTTSIHKYVIAQPFLVHRQIDTLLR